MTSSLLLSKVFSNPKLLERGGLKAFSLILQYGPPAIDYKRNDDIYDYYRNMFELVNNFLYFDLKPALRDHLLSTIAEQYYEMEELFDQPVLNENLRDPELLKGHCKEPLRHILSFLCNSCPLMFFCLISDYMKFDAEKMASVYDITEYNFSMDAEFVDLCSLLLMGYCVYNSPEKAWYKYNGKIWEKVEIKSVAIVLLKKFYIFMSDLTMELQKELESTDNEDEKKALENRISKYKTFCVKKNYLRMKSILEPVEDILCSKEDLLKFNKPEHYFSADNGIVNLQNGRIKPHEPLNYATFCSPVAYIPRSEIDFTRLEGEKLLNYFVDSFCSENAEMRKYFQRWFGYGITGLVCEQQMLIIKGRGSNSKSVLVNLSDDTLGDYFANLPRCVIIDSNSSAGQATPQFEKLTTARLGAVVELKRKDKMHMENIKNITGGDKLPHRNLFKGYEKISTNTKLFVITNEMAKASFSYAYARRIIVFPSEAKFIKGLKKEDKRPGVYPVIFGFDKKMRHKTVLEAFLRFLIEGAMDLFALREEEGYSGIPQPEAVVKATEEYLSSINDIGRFILDITDKNTQTYSDEILFENYKNWYYKYKGQDTYTSFTRFTEELQEMGISPTSEGEYIISADDRKEKARYQISSVQEISNGEDYY
ncbi:Putative VV D5-type primase/helicase [Brazilian cedratvirus IHUMI]|uniref:VV D5-type primase/helicase n=1 Tax=Brazilian cedratvirus IHUMI TaxID=2126980 RepID=A0A2R8FF62_9VIRU|nr:Putative VV D5-type primase/helicase [Brazilian cedratvirus IHUMI]